MRLLEHVLDLVLPPRCGGCGALGAWLCPPCLESISRLREPLCRRCGRELEFAGATCGCAGRLRHLDRLRSVGAYEGRLESAVHRFKYRGWRRLAGPLASLMAAQLAVEGVPAALVLAVPLHERRRRQRGYNQAELLAAELRRRLGLRAPRGRLLRTRETRSQVGLDRLRRRLNVAGAFRWQGPPGRGEPVLLVDDVVTTGATLEACAEALAGAGFGRLTGITLARVSL